MFGSNRLNDQSGSSRHSSRHNHVFVPVTDELIFDTPELIEGPLVPYSSGMACHGWLSVELNPCDDPGSERSSGSRSNRNSGNLTLLQKAARHKASCVTSTEVLKSRRHLKLVLGG